jgi:hypothetical protein
MAARWLLALVALALPAPAAAQTSPPDQAPPDQTPQALFSALIVKDPRTTADIRGLLSAGAGFVAPRPQFADLTGDGKMDAVVQVRVPGAAGTVAVYAFSTDGTSDGGLRAIFRSQALYRATSEVAPGTLLVTLPDYATGDEVCCPAAQTQRRYVWDAKARKLRRRPS